MDAKKKKKKGTLGIGNSSLFFASESDKAPVQKINVSSIIGHAIEGKGKQLNLELDEIAANQIKTDDNRMIRFVASNKGEVEEIWKKIQDSQEKAREANEETEGRSTPAPAIHAAPPPIESSLLPPPQAKTAILPPPTRSIAAAPKVPTTSIPASSPIPASTQVRGEACIALYDFEAQGDDELSVSENESLTLIEKENDDWWKVRNSAGQEGVVPASYVEMGEAEEGEEETFIAAAAQKATPSGNEGSKAEYAAAAAAARAAREEEEERMRREEEEEEEAAVRARMQEERRAKADAQRRAREAEDRRREAIKSQPAPAPPKAHPTTSINSTSATSRDIAIPSGKSAPARPKEASSKSKPSPARTRIWHDRSGQFRVEAEFLGFNSGKIRLHKLNGVVIEVAVEKMSNPDIQYLEEVTGRKLNPSERTRGVGDDSRRSERDKERRREQERENKRRQEAARGPKRNVDWFEFFLAAQVDVDDCTRYAAAFERDKIDENVLPDMEPSVLRSIGLREGDIIRVMKFINKKYKSNGSSSKANSSVSPSDQLKSDEALARKLQEQEQNARRNGITPPPNLFSGPDGSLKNNTRRGRPTPSTSRTMSNGVDAASLAAASESLTRKESSPAISSSAASPVMTKSATPVNGFDDDAWTPRPSSTKPVIQAAPTPPPPPPPSAPPAPVAVPAAPSPAPASTPAEPAKSPADPNSALFDKLAAMKPPSAGSIQRPGASPSNTSSLYNGPRGPYAPVAQNQNLLTPLVSTQGTGQFLPTSMGHQPPGMQPQQTGYMGMQSTGMGYAGNGYGGISGSPSPFGMQAMAPQQTGFVGVQSPQYTGFSQQQQQQSALSPQYTGYQQQAPHFTGFPQQQQQQQLQPQMTNVSGFAQPQIPQFTQQQYIQQQQQRLNDEANSESNPERFSAANVFGQMKQGKLHEDSSKSAQNAQKYDALRPQPTGFQPGGYLNPQFTGYTFQQPY